MSRHASQASSWVVFTTCHRDPSWTLLKRAWHQMCRLKNKFAKLCRLERDSADKLVAVWGCAQIKVCKHLLIKTKDNVHTDTYTQVKPQQKGKGSLVEFTLWSSPPNSVLQSWIKKEQQAMTPLCPLFVVLTEPLAFNFCTQVNKPKQSDSQHELRALGGFNRGCRASHLQNWSDVRGQNLFLFLFFMPSCSLAVVHWVSMKP